MSLAPPQPMRIAAEGTLVAANARQVLLGDDGANALQEQQAKVIATLAAFGSEGVTKPIQLLQFTINLRYKNVGGQQLECDCMFCFMHIHSTGSTRVVDHFLNVCALCPASVKDPCIALRTKTDGKRRSKEEHGTLVKEEQELQLRMVKFQKTELRQESLKAGFKSAESTCADNAVAKFFYANGLNFGAADCKVDSYYREMVRAIQAAPLSYVPPRPERLAGELLETSNTQMLADIAQRDKEGELSRKFGITYTSDGWDSCDNLPLINSAYMLANDGGVYQRSVDTSGATKNAEYCASLMITDIYDIGCFKVVMLVTDTCAVMRKCWDIVQDEFPWILVAPCQTHCPSLLLNRMTSRIFPSLRRRLGMRIWSCLGGRIITSRWSSSEKKSSRPLVRAAR